MNKELPKVKYKANNNFMQEAIIEARVGIHNYHGGPFGAVVVKDGVIVGRGHNCVLLNKDSTCHGEMEAIRAAERNLDTYSLKGCVLYTTGEPCNMCLTAILWANIDKVYYGCSIKENETIGFRDKKFDDLFGGREKLSSFLIKIDNEACIDLFNEYNSLKHITY